MKSGVWLPPLLMRFTPTKDGVHLYVLTCVFLFRVLGTAGCNALNFGVWVEGYNERIMLKCGMLLDPLAMCFTLVMSGGYLHLRKYNSNPFLSTFIRFRSFVAQKASYDTSLVRRGLH